MIFLFMILFPLLSEANLPSRWSSIVKITERHEFYQNNEVIGKPKDSWETLFAAVYPNRDSGLSKDCVYYKVPGTEMGKLKIKRTVLPDPCENYRFSKGDEEWDNIKSFQFSVSTQQISMLITREKFKVEKWELDLLNELKSEDPQQLMSSADYKSSPIIVLSKETRIPTVPKHSEKKAVTLCHDVDEDCVEKSSSTCNDCLTGWYEVPNGCKEGPKYCGVQECGPKGQPACRRGIRHQRVSKKFECRLDASFAYCANGLIVQCEGSLAYCR